MSEEKIPEAAPPQPSTVPAPESQAKAAPSREMSAVDPDAPLPGEVFVRTCPGCGMLKQTADPTGKTECRPCRARPPVEHAAAGPASTSGADSLAEAGRHGEVVQLEVEPAIGDR